MGTPFLIQEDGMNLKEKPLCKINAIETDLIGFLRAVADTLESKGRYTEMKNFLLEACHAQKVAEKFEIAKKYVVIKMV